MAYVVKCKTPRDKNSRRIEKKLETGFGNDFVNMTAKSTGNEQK